MAKRAFDLTVSLIALVLLAPVLIGIAAIIALESGRPVFFRQERIGRHGRPFRIAKFRTMFVGAAQSGPAITKTGDARITRLGRWLRRTKLDELPQLYNVVIGDMSLVGPRPEVARFINYYPENCRNIILSVRPGITDEASIRFSNEGDLLANAQDPECLYIHDILPTKIGLYVRYVESQSVRRDISILLRTLLRLVGGVTQ